MNILQAMDDANLFAPWFRRGDWRAWRAFLAGLFGLAPEDGGVLWRSCTGRTSLPTSAFGEAWLVIGRRGGKSFVLALVAVFVACFRDHRPYLAPGETGTIMVLAADRRQARVILRYVRALLTEVPMLKRLVTRETAEGIELRNRVAIEVHAASFRTVRGYTLVAALCDEIAFWRSEDSANPDAEILAALRPAMATIPGAMLLCASSPYARRGALYDAWRRHHGRDDSGVLVWQAPSRVMNQAIPAEILEQAYAEDPASAAAEYGAEFRRDVEGFVEREVVAACVSPGVRERGPRSGVRYRAFVDPSGGSADAMTLAICHVEGEVTILDCLRERRAPFSPDAVVEEFATVLRAYRCFRVHGDRYAGEWPRDAFRARGISYAPAVKPKSDLFRDLLPLLNSRRVDLLDHDGLVAQIASLERRTSRGGRDSIDHPPGRHDDLANAVAGAMSLAAGAGRATARIVRVSGI